MIKWSLFLFFLGIIQVFAVDTYSQKTFFSMKFQKVQLEYVLNEIENKSEYYFLYNQDDVDVEQVIDVSVEKQSITQVLDQLLNKRGINYSIQNRQIVLTSVAEDNQLEVVQKNHVKGRVTDASGVPLPGVTVVVKGTAKGGITDTDGNYSLANVPDEAIIIFSFVGMETQEVEVNGRLFINVTLKEKVSEVDEVVVTAFGIERQRKALGYATSTISSEEIIEAGTTNFATALTGKVSGVQVCSSPGGPSSGVYMQIRGINSISNDAQPLYIVDGVPIRNDYILSSGSTRVAGNGILDINPDDIADLTVLKGASASALYGSEAACGVVLITTKKQKAGKGLGVEVRIQHDLERLAFQPDYQEVYGPGYDRETNVNSVGTDEEGFITETDGSYHPYYYSYGQFGAKFDGREITYADGSIIPYSASKNNYSDFFEKGNNTTTNVAIYNKGDMGSFRLAFGNTDYKGIYPGYTLDKYNFNLNADINLAKKVKLSVVANYINDHTHNRSTRVYNFHGSYSGFFSRLDNMDILRNKYKTTKGYRWVGYAKNYDLDERLLYRVRGLGTVMTQMWNAYENNCDEYKNRFINSATLSAEITDNWSVRGKLGIDFTNKYNENKNPNQYSTMFGTSGSYSIASGRSTLTYGDVLLSYKNKVTPDLNLTATLGYSGKKSNYTAQSSSTKSGLIIENWYYLSNSSGTNTTSNSLTNYAYQAGFGIIDLAYKDFLFVQGTGRYEQSSNLAPGKNTFFYPSFNGSFILSEVVDLPQLFNYAKVRGALGVVGNSPTTYQAAVLYSTSTLYPEQGSLISQSSASSGYGNDGIKSEKKVETEFGLEFSMLDNRINIDMSYYYNVINDQIMTLTTPASVGATSALSNVGKLSNQGFEFSINSNILHTMDYSWDVSFNFAVTKNKLLKLTDDVDYLQLFGLDGNALIIRADEGEEIGNIYVRPVETDENGNEVINSYGYYSIDNNSYKKIGSVVPKGIGGISNSFRYKDFNLDVSLDYKLGGDLVSSPMHYEVGAGMFESTLKYRDAEHGGLSYNITSSGEKILASDGAYNDGLILKGVDVDGNENTKVIDAASYYLNTFGWGAGATYYNRYDNAANENSYLRVRQIVLSYNIPTTIVSKLGLQKIQLSLMGKNLWYLWKTLPNNWDPECMVRTSWINAGKDSQMGAPVRSYGFAIKANF